MATYRKLPLTLSGLALGVIAAIITAFGAGRVLVSGPSNARDYFGDENYDVDAGFIAFVIVLGILIAAAVGLPYLWARLVGIGLTAFLALALVVAVVAARSDDVFAANYDVSLGSGGVILIVAFLVAATGLVLAPVGSRELGADRYGPPAPPPSTAGSSGWAVASLVLGIAGFVTFFTGAVAVAFAGLAFAEIRHSPGRRGRGLAVAGLMLGLVVLGLYGLVLLLSALFAGPS